MIVTFYSYKGGVGRSMALVNIGEMLADVGYDVIVCDFDLEAPGLERYVTDDVGASVRLQANRGVIDLLEEYKDILSDPGAPEREAERDGFANVNGLLLRRPSSYAITMPSPNTGRLGRLRLLGAGRRDGQHAAAYSEWVQHFNWSDFYKRWAGAAYIDFFRRDLTQDKTVVLIDSRTGVTEHGGICTYHLADLVVLLTAPNDINLEGTRWMTAVLGGAGVSALRKDRPLQVMPVAARVEIASQAEELAAFRERFEAEFASAVPQAAGDATAFIQDAEIPYIPYFAFREKVVARQTGSPHRELYRAYQTLAQAIVGVGLSRELLPAPRRQDWLDTRRLGRAEPTVDGILRRHKEWLESSHTAGSRADLRGYDLSRKSLTGVDLREADLTEANLEQSSLREANLSGAELTDAILTGARLQDARLIGTNLGGSELTQAVLTGAVLDNARLEGANLEGASLEGAKLRFASLRRARLVRANLASCDLRDCDLADATLLGADIRSADLTGATGVDGGELKRAIVDDSTRLDQAQASALGRASAGRPATRRAAYAAEIVPKQGQREFPGFAEDFRFLEKQAQPYFEDLNQTGKRLAGRYRVQQALVITLFTVTLIYSLSTVVVLLSLPKLSRLEIIAFTLAIIAIGGLAVTGLFRWRDRSRSYRQQAERIRRECFIFLGRIGEYEDTEKRYDRFKRNVHDIMSEAGSDG